MEKGGYISSLKTNMAALFNITVPEPLDSIVRNRSKISKNKPHSTVWSHCKIVQ